jgi:hypothetical protein
LDIWCLCTAGNARKDKNATTVPMSEANNGPERNKTKKPEHANTLSEYKTKKDSSHHHARMAINHKCSIYSINHISTNESMH